jgi:flagellar basal-body rod protein FlgG
MAAQQTIVDVTANNLANINTAGFKRSQVDFQDLMYVKLQYPSDQEASGPTGFEIGSGVRPASTLKVFSGGELQNTGRQMDIAIEGDGFFVVQLPAGQSRYTRDGSFRLNANGQFVTASGYILQPAITVPQGTREISISADGTVSVRAGDSEQFQEVGQITLAKFTNPSGMTSEGNNVLAESPASGSATTAAPGESGLGTMRQGFLEKSNVQMVTELVNLITAQRAYEVNARAIKAGDEMLTTANHLIS